MNDKTEKDSGFVVTAPLINVRVQDAAGTYVLQGFYAGATLPEGVHEDDLDKQERKGLIASKGSPEADAATPFGKPVQFDDNGNPMSDEQVAEAEKKRQDRASARTQSRTSEAAKSQPVRSGVSGKQSDA